MTGLKTIQTDKCNRFRIKCPLFFVNLHHQETKLVFMEKQRVLFVSQEIFPFLPKNELSYTAKRLPQEIQELGKEIRVFTPRYGCINERRHQLHEVIRLSGMNIIINDYDHPLIIKVASVPSAKMQVYFTDNDEFFRRKHALMDEKGNFFEDNDERSIFFSRSVLETVKKLGWQPDIIFCVGWMGMMIPLYLKEFYAKDPHFSNTKVVLSLCNASFNENFSKDFAEKLKFDGFNDDIIRQVGEGSFKDVFSVATEYADGLAVFSNNLSEVKQSIVDNASCPKLEFESDEVKAKELSEFFDKVINEESLVS